MKKRLFSGTSLFAYELHSALSKRDDTPLQAYTMFTESAEIAFNFALKRARQDNSIAIIIEIKDIKEFEIKKAGHDHYIVKGAFNKENSKIYMRNKLNELVFLIFRIETTLQKIYNDNQGILSLLGLN